MMLERLTTADQRRLLGLLKLDFLPLFLDPGILEDRGDNGYHVLKVLGMSLLGVRMATIYSHSQRLDMYA